MKLPIKKLAQKLLARFGYGLTRLDRGQVPLETFKSLSQAYEQLIIETKVHAAAIPPDETRHALLARLLGTSPAEAFYIIDALVQTREIAGDVCEFGVAQGETSALIANEILPTNKVLHLFDSFEGLPKPTVNDALKDDIFSLGSMEAYTGTMSNPESLVLARLKKVKFPDPRKVIHKGFVEQIIKTERNLPAKVSFAYIDFDFYEPIGIALEFLHDRTDAGAMMVVDDYDFFSTGAKKAVDEFVSEKNSAGTVYEMLVPNTRYGYFAVLTKKR
jgi:O-methyltransferase